MLELKPGPQPSLLQEKFGLLLTEQKAASLLGLSQEHIRKLRLEGHLPSFLMGTEYLIPERAIAAYIEAEITANDPRHLFHSEGVSEGMRRYWASPAAQHRRSPARAGQRERRAATAAAVQARRVAIAEAAERERLAAATAAVEARKAAKVTA